MNEYISLITFEFNLLVSLLEFSPASRVHIHSNKFIRNTYAFPTISCSSSFHLPSYGLIFHLLCRPYPYQTYTLTHVSWLGEQKKKKRRKTDRNRKNQKKWNNKNEKENLMRRCMVRDIVCAARSAKAQWRAMKSQK